MVNLLMVLLVLTGLSPFQRDLMKKNDKIKIDSNVSFEEALKGKEIPDHIIEKLTVINVEYYSFDHKVHRGQLVVDKTLASDIKEIFKVIKKHKFPIAKVIPVNQYDWDDNKSMDDNNTSCFNFRTIAGTNVMSKHSLGRAIDINPFQNPEIKGERVSPQGAKYNVKFPGTVKPRSWLVIEFKKRGWQWGGDWTTKKDYQHFEKPIQGHQ